MTDFNQYGFIELTKFSKEPEHQEKQRQVLQKAVHCYLAWQNNKEAPDDRGYPVGWLTKIRHWTKFGLTRANKLDKNLSAKKEHPNRDGERIRIKSSLFSRIYFCA